MQRHMYFDKTEIIVRVAEKKKYKTINLLYNHIQRVEIKSCEERQYVFFKKPSHQIIIVTNKMANPIVMTRLQEKKFFDEYVEELETFCKANHITFIKKM